MYFADENTGWVAGDLGIYKTTDGGTTWVHPYTGYAALHSMSFINSTTGWVVGEGGTTYEDNRWWNKLDIDHNRHIE